MKPRLKEKYLNEVLPRLQEKLGVTNRLAVPRLLKIVVNMGTGVVERDELKVHAEELSMLTGQKPVVTKARKSISNFKVRTGMPIGLRVTLRGNRMYEFLDRLISAALPRIRDFRGLSPHSFDGRGNYTLGVKEQTIFPEIDPNRTSRAQGMDITIVTTAGEDSRAFELLKLLGMPFASN
ncbi:MAG: 50S ribosomal protein L5 [Kiritimatiellia bacterium]